jgi:hypothetical protein
VPGQTLGIVHHVLERDGVLAGRGRRWSGATPTPLLPPFFGRIDSSHPAAAPHKNPRLIGTMAYSAASRCRSHGLGGFPGANCSVDAGCGDPAGSTRDLSPRLCDFREAGCLAERCPGGACGCRPGQGGEDRVTLLAFRSRPREAVHISDRARCCCRLRAWRACLCVRLKGAFFVCAVGKRAGGSAACHHGRNEQALPIAGKPPPAQEPPSCLSWKPPRLAAMTRQLHAALRDCLPSVRASRGEQPDWPPRSVQAWPVLHHQHRHASVREDLRCLAPQP